MTIFYTLILCLCITTLCHADNAPLDWDQIKTLALTHNLELRMAQEVVTASMNDIQVLQSQQKPQVMVHASWATLRKGTTPSGKTIEWKTDTDASQSQATLGLSQLLWDGGKISAQIQSAETVFAQANDTLGQQLVTLRYTLRTQFLSLWAAQELLKLNQKIVKRRDTQFKQLSYKYKAGLENIGALSIAQANLMDAQFQMSDTRRRIKTHKRELESTVGCTFDGDRPTGPELSEKIDPSRIDALASQHPMAQFAAHQIQVIQSQLAYQHALYQPDVLFNLQADKVIANPFHSPATSTDQWGASITGTWKIWDSGERDALVKGYEAQLRHAKLNYDNTVKTIKTSLYTAYLDYESAKEGLENQKNTLSAIEERSTIMSKQYESGLVTFNDWSLIEDRRIGSEKAVIQAQLALYLAVDAWILARGGHLHEAI